MNFPIKYSKVTEFEISEEGYVSETNKIIMPNGSVRILSVSGYKGDEMLQMYLSMTKDSLDMK
jgi:hypothetical protein